MRVLYSERVFLCWVVGKCVCVFGVLVYMCSCVCGIAYVSV